MVIDGNGRFLSQREYPVMATIRTALSAQTLGLSVESMPATLQLPLAVPRSTATVRASVWGDGVSALDEGDAAAHWLSQVMQASVRLVRFDRAQPRYASKKWTGDADAPVEFADGFPLLVTNEASLAEVNRRLNLKGAPAIAMDRFRPNIVLNGLEAFDEDFIDTVSIGDNDEILLRLVKPCSRCPITTIDQSRGQRDAAWPHEPLDTMAGWRADARVDGGLTFGQNAIVLAGQGRRLTVGAEARCAWNFPESF